MSDKVTVTWKDGLHLEAHTPEFDDVIPLDADETVGGQGKGHRPLRMLLIGLGGCMMMDVVSILNKKRQVYSDFDVTFDYEQSDQHPHIYTTITMHFIIKGSDISEEALGRALELSYTKYCPANAMLKATADIKYTYAVIHEAPIAEEA